MIYKIRRFSFRDDFPRTIKLKSGIILKQIEDSGLSRWLNSHFSFFRKLSERVAFYEVYSGNEKIGESMIELEEPSIMHVGWLGIDESYRGQGYATEILKFYIETGKSLGMKKIILEASRMGFPVYKKLGFRYEREPKPYKRSLFQRFINWSWGMDLDERDGEVPDNFGDLIDMTYDL